MYAIVNFQSNHVNQYDFSKFIKYYEQFNIDGFIFLLSGNPDFTHKHPNTKTIICDDTIPHSISNEFSKVIRGIDTDFFIFLDFGEYVDITQALHSLSYMDKNFDIDVYYVCIDGVYLPRIYRKKTYYRLDKIYGNELPFVPNMSARLESKPFILNDINHKKSIIFVYLNFFQGGIETRTYDEIKIYQNLGYVVYILVLGGKTDLNSIPDGTIVLACHKNILNIRDWIFCVGQLRYICNYFDIDVIYSQASGYTLWLSAIVASLNKKPLLHTLHGSSALTESSTYHWQSFIYKYILAKEISCVYSMSQNLGKRAQLYGEVIVAENVVDTDRFCYQQQESVDARWLVIGRVDGDKLVGIANFIEYAYKAGIPGVVVVGSNSANSERALIEGCYSSDILKGYVDFVGHKSSDEIVQLINGFSGVAGVGRAVLEGMACEKPTCVIGINGSVRGLVRENNFHIFAESVFNGSNMPNITVDKLKQQIQEVSKEELREIRKLIEKDYSVYSWMEKIKVWEKNYKPFHSHFMEVLFSRLCYFSDVIEGSFVQSEVFVKIIEDLIYSPKYYSIELIDAFNKYKHHFDEKNFYPSPYKSRSNIVIDVEESINDGQIIFSAQNIAFNSMNNDLCWGIDTYLLSNSKKYKMVVSYIVESDCRCQDELLFSFVFKDVLTGDIGDDVNQDRISKMSKSSDSRAGYFRYMPILYENTPYENKITIEIDEGIELNKLKLINWSFFKKESKKINIISLNISVYKTL